MMDISQSERLDKEIFDLILTKGPITVYSASKEYGIALATIHRHFKEMENEKEIKIYREEPHQSGNPKKLYGPTIPGIFGFCSDFESIRKKFDSIYEKWIKEKPFVNDIKQEFGFSEDFIQQNPREVIQICKKYMKFHNDALDVLDDEDFLDEHIAEVGFFLHGIKNPKKYLEITKELYEKIPKFRLQMDAMFVGMYVIWMNFRGDNERLKEFYENVNSQSQKAPTSAV